MALARPVSRIVSTAAPRPVHGSLLQWLRVPVCTHEQASSHCMQPVHLEGMIFRLFVVPGPWVVRNADREARSEPSVVAFLALYTVNL